MSEIVDRTIEYLPYVGALAGAAIGMGAETIAQNKVAQEQQALAAVTGDVVEIRQDTLVERAKRYGKASLVGAGVVIGLVNGIAWQPDSTQMAPPYLGVVIDHSGAVGLNQEIRTSVDGIASRIDTGDVDATAFVAGYGEVRTVELDEVSNLEAAGDAPLDMAITTALGQARKARRQNGNLDSQAGILMITNGNLAGSTDALVAEATTNKVKVFVANVEGETNPATIDELKKVSKETGGTYFDVQSTETVDMAGKIEEELDKNKLTQDQPNRWPLKVTAGILGVVTYVNIFNNRRKEPTHRRIV